MLDAYHDILKVLALPKIHECLSRFFEIRDPVVYHRMNSLLLEKRIHILEHLTVTNGNATGVCDKMQRIQ